MNRPPSLALLHTLFIAVKIAVKIALRLRPPSLAPLHTLSIAVKIAVKLAAKIALRLRPVSGL